MNCPKCGGENPDTSKFCGHCGAKLPAVDPAAQIKKTAAFDLGQLPFGGGGRLETDGMATLVQPTLPREDAPLAAAPAVEAQVLNPAPSAPPRADSPLVSASAGPTEVQPAVEEPREARPAPMVVIEPIQPATPVTPAPLPAVAPVAQPAPEPAPPPPGPQAPSAAAPASAPPADAPPAGAAEGKPSAIAPAQAKPPKADSPKGKASKIATPKAKAKAASAPGEDPASAPSAKPQDSTPVPGQFRETKWFMDALDPEKLNRVEIDDIRDRGAAFVDDGSSIDESFSLRSGAHQKLRSTELDLVKAELQAAEERSRGAGLGIYALMALVLGGLGAAAWFLFLR